jgi:hypothetical protein
MNHLEKGQQVSLIPRENAGMSKGNPAPTHFSGMLSTCCRNGVRESRAVVRLAFTPPLYIPGLTG